MMVVILMAAVLAYLIGSVPSGYLVVRALTGQDLRKVGSGRTGGTNAMRAGGLGAGLVTGVLDVLKGAAAVCLTRFMLSGQIAQLSGFAWVEVAAAIAVVIGHIWSLYLGFRGGAGTGPNVGAAIALWPYTGFILPPLVPLVLFSTGYASIASLSTAMLIPFLFALAASGGRLPWEFVGYGLATGCIVTWALRPNLVRLRNGTERRVTWPWKRRPAAFTPPP
jgi:glycerol-3-phosphate acyltransferase PlsY